MPLSSKRKNCPDSFPSHIFAGCVRSLERKYWSRAHIKGAYIEGGGVEAARITPDGRVFLAENPKLMNPIKWVRIIEFAIPVIISIIALCISCSKL